MGHLLTSPSDQIGSIYCCCLTSNRVTQNPTNEWIVCIDLIGWIYQKVPVGDRDRTRLIKNKRRSLKRH